MPRWPELDVHVLAALLLDQLGQSLELAAAGAAAMGRHPHVVRVLLKQFKGVLEVTELQVGQIVERGVGLVVIVHATVVGDWQAKVTEQLDGALAALVGDRDVLDDGVNLEAARAVGDVALELVHHLVVRQIEVRQVNGMKPGSSLEAARHSSKLVLGMMGKEPQ